MSTRAFSNRFSHALEENIALIEAKTAETSSFFSYILKRNDPQGGAVSPCQCRGLESQGRRSKVTSCEDNKINVHMG